MRIKILNNEINILPLFFPNLRLWYFSNDTEFNKTSLKPVTISVSYQVLMHTICYLFTILVFNLSLRFVYFTFLLLLPIIINRNISSSF